MPNFGYARVSTPEQSIDRQVEELRAHGCERVFGIIAAQGRAFQTASPSTRTRRRR